MKIEELTQEQIEKAKSLATDAERLDYLKECGVELDDDMMAEVCGGEKVPLGDKNKSGFPCCQKGPNKGYPHKYKKTGNRKKGWLLGWIDDKEYKCIYCGKTTWRDW